MARNTQKFTGFLLFVVLTISIANPVDDILPMFGDKACIEVFTMQTPSDKVSNVMIEEGSSNMFSPPSLINLTEILSQNQGDKHIMSKLNELAQYNNIEYTWKLISEEGPPHSKIYTVTLSFGNELYEGSGKSLKKAQQAAASLALSNTNYERPEVKIKEDKILTPTVVLNNIAVKLGVAVTYHLITDESEKDISNYNFDNNNYGALKKSYYQKWNGSAFNFRVPTEAQQITGPFSVKVKVDNDFFVGLGHTIQAARHDAAIKALKYLEKQVSLKNNVCLNDDSSDLCTQKRENLKSPITRVYEAGQKHGLDVDFTVLAESGKSHKKVFVTQCKLGDFVTEGKGNSKKESKRAAAEKMIENLSKLPEVFSENAIVIGLTSKKKKSKKRNPFKKSQMEKLTDSIAEVLSTVLSSGDKVETSSAPQKKNSNNFTPKNKLLEISNLLKVDVQFTDFYKREDQFFTLMSIGINPPHVCLGIGSSEQESHEKVALHGLKFLQKSGLLDIAELSSKDQKIVSEYDFEKDFASEDENGRYSSAGNFDLS